MNTAQSTPPSTLDSYPGFSRAFALGRLTIGFISPAEGYPDSPMPNLRNQAAIVRKLVDIDAAACGCAMCPFYDPSFGDRGQVLDPWCLPAGWLR